MPKSRHINRFDMTDRVPIDTSVEVVLDNRKLILVFGVLIALCIVFFVLGFVEGKRQGAKLEADKITRARLDTPAFSEPEANAGGENSSAKPMVERPVRDELNWYKNLNQKAQPVTTLPAPDSPVTSAPSKAKGPSSPEKDKFSGRSKAPNLKSPPQPLVSRRATYSLQIGAFRQRKEAATAVSALGAKGYTCIITPPTAGDSYYRLKVGQFDSRADAIAMQLKLKKDGFVTLIKTN
jgi:cell division protein FtsN